MVLSSLSSKLSSLGMRGLFCPKSSIAGTLKICPIRMNHGASKTVPRTLFWKICRLFIAFFVDLLSHYWRALVSRGLQFFIINILVINFIIFF